MQVEALLAEHMAGSDSEDAYLAGIGDILPEDMEYSEEEISWTESDDARMIDCALQVMPFSEKGPRTRWVRHNLMGKTEDDEWF